MAEVVITVYIKGIQLVLTSVHAVCVLNKHLETAKFSNHDTTL